MSKFDDLNIMQDYKEAAKAILNELLADVTGATLEKIENAGETEEGDTRQDLQVVEEACSMDVSFSSAPRNGDSEEEDIEDFASAEEEEDIAAITEGLMTAKLETPLATEFEDSNAIETWADDQAVKSTRKLVQELLDSEVVGQVHTPVTNRITSSSLSCGRSDLTPVTFPTSEMGQHLVSLENVDKVCTPLQLRVEPPRLSKDLAFAVSPDLNPAASLNPYPSTPVSTENLSETSSGLTDLIKRVRVASEVETPAALPISASATFATALTPFDLPRLVMDSPPIPAIKLPASPPVKSAAIKRHLFDSPMLTGQMEQSNLEAVLQPTLVARAAPETLMRSVTPEEGDPKMHSPNPLKQAWTSSSIGENREGFGMCKEKLY